MTEDHHPTEEPDDEAPIAQRRRRGTGFPVVPLSEAATVLKEAGKYGFEHSTAAFATYMGHRTTNSGAFRQRLAAFRDWKFVAGQGDRLAMTEIARMIALPTDEAAERRALQAAFMNSPVFRKLYEGSAKGQPLAAGGLGGRAVHDFGIAPSSKDKVAQSFTDSAIAAGLAERTDDGRVVLLPLEADGAAEDELAVPPHATGATGDVAPSPVKPQSHQRSVTPPVVHQVWDIETGTINFEIRTAKPLPASAFVTVGEVVASLERLATALATEPAVDVNVGEDSED